ncbi:SDR family oxidoreductase [Rhodococcus sp. NPDC057529]|uniref:SDR family oxidoreductase n=1 Tax=Rhodococcus sp. NPDC057529 TaxID=3346158 RepID=UPI00366B9A6F
MELELNGRVALITAAAGGLGSAVAHALGNAGATLVLVDREELRVKEVARELGERGIDVTNAIWDMSDHDGLDRLVDSVLAERGQVDVLVNITGGPPTTQAFGVDRRVWRDNFETMVQSVIGLTDSFLPGMMDRKWGRVITSTSSGVVTPISGLTLSNTLRASLVTWSKTLASEVGERGVTSNIVVPGRILTRRVQALDRARAEQSDRAVEDVVAESTRSIALRRYGSPREFADLVTFLASERASYITGSAIRVDGGLIPSV